MKLLSSLSLNTLTLSVIITLSLTACGGEGGASDKIKKEYDRIEDKVGDVSDDIADDYKKFESNLKKSEKDMAKIIKSVSLPETNSERLDSFLDKITPEGGKGGLYVGNFVEVNDNDANDIDIGAIYFDIPKDFGGSVDGRISYQQQPCQENRTLSASSAVKLDRFTSGKFNGSLDSLDALDIKYIRDLDIETPNILTTFSGKFKKGTAGSPWAGRFEYQDGTGKRKLSAGEDNCNVSYSLSTKSDYHVYPLSYNLGNLDVKMTGNGSTTSLSWNTPENTSLVLVSQVDISVAESGANGYKRNQVFSAGETNYSPVISDTSTNYAFVVQAFNATNDMIAYDAMIMDLPEAQ